MKNTRGKASPRGQTAPVETVGSFPYLSWCAVSRCKHSNLILLSRWKATGICLIHYPQYFSTEPFFTLPISAILYKASPYDLTLKALWKSQRNAILTRVKGNKTGRLGVESPGYGGVYGRCRALTACHRRWMQILLLLFRGAVRARHLPYFHDKVRIVNAQRRIQKASWSE